MIPTTRRTIGFDGRPVAVFAGGRKREPGYGGEIRHTLYHELDAWCQIWAGIAIENRRVLEEMAAEGFWEDLIDEFSEEMT